MNNGMRRNPFANFRGYAGVAGFGDAPPQMVPPGYPGMPGSPAAALPPNYGPQSGLAPAINSSLEGVLDPQLDGSDYFFYGTDSGSIAQNATTNSSIQIDAGTDFLWIATTFFAIVSGGGSPLDSGTIPIPEVTVLITDTGATKNLSNAPIPVPSIAGTGNFPYRLIEPRLFRANSTINFTWNSVETTATTYSHIFWTMHGIRKIAGTFNLA